MARSLCTASGLWSATPTLEGSHWFPFTSWLSAVLLGLSLHPYTHSKEPLAPRATLFQSSLRCLPSAISLVCVSTPAGSWGLWDRNLGHPLLNIRGLPFSLSEGPLLPCDWAGLSTCQPPLGLSPVLFLLFFFLTKACATHCP